MLWFAPGYFPGIFALHDFGTSVLFACIFATCIFATVFCNGVNLWWPLSFPPSDFTDLFLQRVLLSVITKFISQLLTWKVAKKVRKLKNGPFFKGKLFPRYWSKTVNHGSFLTLRRLKNLVEPALRVFRSKKELTIFSAPKCSPQFVP